MLYTVECTYIDPASEDEWNAFYSLEPLRFVEIELGYHPVEMRASWREKSSTSRLAYVLPRIKAAQLAAIPGAYLYQPLTAQLHNPTAITPEAL